MSGKRAREETGDEAIGGAPPSRSPEGPEGPEVKTVQFNTMALAFRSACQRAEAFGETYPAEMQSALASVHRHASVERIK